MIALCSSRTVEAIAHESARLRAPGLSFRWATYLGIGLWVVGLVAVMPAHGADPSQREKAMAGDPAGDARPSAGEPIDIVGFDAFRQGDHLRIQLETADSMSPADSGRPDALFGFVDLDIDQQQSTGESAMAEFLRLSQSDIGSDLVIDLSTYRTDDGKVDLVDGQGGVERVAASFDTQRLELQVPVASLGGDAAVSTSAVVGNSQAVTDAVPDGGFMATTDGATDGVVLGGGRFAIDVSWRNASGGSGAGSVVFQSDDSAVFWFFTAGNWELMLKVIDGCVLNDRFWVFSAATTDVEFTVRVTDTVSGAVKTYRNPLGTSAPAITDTNAFATCGMGS